MDHAKVTTLWFCLHYRERDMSLLPLQEEGYLAYSMAWPRLICAEFQMVTFSFDLGLGGKYTLALPTHMHTCYLQRRKKPLASEVCQPLPKAITFNWVTEPNLKDNVGYLLTLQKKMLGKITFYGRNKKTRGIFLPREMGMIPSWISVRWILVVVVT